MSDTPGLAARIRTTLERLAGSPEPATAEGFEEALREGLERTLHQLEDPSVRPPAGEFRFRMTGGEPIVSREHDAVPMDPMEILRLFRTWGLELQAGESVVLDEELLASVIQRDVARLSAEYRSADQALQRTKAPRERDHAAVGAADRRKMQLRGRLNQLNAALQAARNPSKE